MDRGWSPEGGQLLLSGSRAGFGELWSNEGTAYAQITGDAYVGVGGGGSWSPDGSEVAFVKLTTGRKDIWIVDSDGEERPLTTGGMAADGAASVRWSPTGDLVAFVSRAGGMKRVWTVPVQGGEPRPLATPVEVLFASWSPDGRRLAVASGSPGSSDIWTVSLDGHEERRLVAGPGINTQPDWSPDGSQIAFASNRPRPGETESSWNIWRVAATGGEIPLLVAGHSPQWSHDASQILHVWDDNVWTSPVAGGGPIYQLIGVGNNQPHPH